MCNALQQYFGLPGRTQEAMAAEIGVKQATISRWSTGRVPAERVLQVEQATGGVITRHDIRPDIYPKEAA